LGKLSTHPFDGPFFAQARISGSITAILAPVYKLKQRSIMKPIAIPLFLFCVAFLSPRAWGVTATYTNSTQNVTLTGLGGSGGVGQSQVSWGTCAYDGTHTNCTVSAPYTGVGGGGTISMVLSYLGNGTSPFTANSTSPGSNTITFGILPGNSGSIVVSLQESTGANVTFLSNNFVFYYSSATCTGIVAASCAVGQVGLTPGATITGTVYGTFDATPVIVAVVSASSFGEFSSVAPGTWMEIYGTNLANVTSQTWGSADFNGNLAPTTLGGNTVTIGGQSAFIDFISPLQTNALAPSNTPTGPQPVVVTTPGGTSAPFTVPVNVTEPGLDAPPSFNIGGVLYVVALFADGSFVLPANAIPGVPSRPAQPGDEIVLYGIGFGGVAPNIPAGQLVEQANSLTSSFQMSIGGVPVTNVPYFGLAPSYTGLYQFDVVVPANVGTGAVPLTFTVGGGAGTQTLSLAVSN
jgi:uncharacterized protein (TIGR03437 family)